MKQKWLKAEIGDGLATISIRVAYDRLAWVSSPDPPILSPLQRLCDPVQPLVDRRDLVL
jgi:hypothetical protein